MGQATQEHVVDRFRAPAGSGIGLDWRMFVPGEVAEMGCGWGSARHQWLHSRSFGSAAQTPRVKQETGIGSVTVETLIGIWVVIGLGESWTRLAVVRQATSLTPKVHVLYDTVSQVGRQISCPAYLVPSTESDTCATHFSAAMNFNFTRPSLLDE